MDDSVQLFEIKEMRISIERLQYICDDFNQSEVEWMNLNDMTVCDTKGQEHLNICTLQNFTTSYFGKCRVCRNCRAFLNLITNNYFCFSLFKGLLFNVWSCMRP